MSARIAIFEGYTSKKPRRKRRLGGPIFNNPRPPLAGYGTQYVDAPRGYMGSSPPRYVDAPRGYMNYGTQYVDAPRGYMGGYGRRNYSVESQYAPSSYGPVDERGRPAKKLKTRGYKVKKGRNSSWQVKFKKTAKKCARVSKRRGARKGSYQACMRKHLKKSKRSRR